MGRGSTKTASQILFGPALARKRIDFARLVAERHPKAFYVLFEQRYAEQMEEFARARLEAEYPPSQYEIEVMLAAHEFAADASFEELESEQDDEYLVECEIRPRSGGGALHFYDGFYLSAQELLDLDWHGQDAGFRERCLALLTERGPATSSD